jgi:NTP pyrophosphatase (non-canonical NTP hydrolase)
MGKLIPDQCDGLARLQAVVHDLRSPEGCPWDREQTHTSLTSNMLEEAYEAVEALRAGDPEHMKEELGDVLLIALPKNSFAAIRMSTATARQRRRKPCSHNGKPSSRPKKAGGRGCFCTG